MTDPTTPNILLAVPTRGSDPGTWDTPVNNNSAALDGYFGGVQSISVSNVPITLTAPAGTVTAGGGPTQAQNAVLRFTGAPTTSITVTLPLPGYYIIENLTTGANITLFRGVGSGQIVCIEQGAIRHIYNDGTNVRFVNLSSVGTIEIWAGLIAMPTWVTSCTIPPYLLCDGFVYNATNYPYLTVRLGAAFGGNGTTTFGVPDLRGRVALPYDTTGRITAAVSGITGTTIGAAGGNQNYQSHSHTYSGVTGTENQSHSHAITGGKNYAYTGTSGGGIGGGGSFGVSGFNVLSAGSEDAAHNHNYSGTTGGAGAGNSGNVQPSIITGIAVIRAA